MKKLIVLLTMMVGTLVAQAYDYPYLTFEKANGTKTSVSTDGLTIDLSSATLTAGGQTFSLADLSKMYFSTLNETAIAEVEARTLGSAVIEPEDEASDVSDTNCRIFDLQGREISRDQMKQGVYIIKVQGENSSRVLKVNIK